MQISSKVFCLLLFLFASEMSSAQGIEFFHGTWQEAIEEAKKEDKIIFVDAYTTWCGPCKRMAKNVFTQKKVGDYFNANFLNLKIDMEKTNGREFGAKYPVSAYPTLFFLAPDGKLVKKTVGGKKVDGLIAIGKEIIAKYDYSAKHREAYKAGDHSYETVFGYIEGMNKSRKSSLKVANDFLYSDHGMTDSQLTDFLFLAATEIDSKIYERMIDRKELVVKKYGIESFADKVVSAAKNTVKKAINYEDESLLKDALTAVKKEAKSKYPIFESESKMEWAIATKDEKAYLKSSKKYLKNINKSEKRIDWARSTREKFGSSDKVNQLVLTTIEKDMIVSKDKNNIGMYCKLLLVMNEKEKALAYANTALTRFDDQGMKNYILSMIKYIENYNP